MTPILDSAIAAQGGGVDASGGSSSIDGPVTAEGSISGAASGESNTPIDIDDIEWFVRSRLNGVDATHETEIEDGVTLEGNETYYDPDGFTLQSEETVTADVSEGNVTLVVDGPMEFDKGDLIVTDAIGTNNALRVFATGDLSMKNGVFGVDHPNDSNSIDSKHLQVYGLPTMQVGMVGGSTMFEGILYAPREEEVPGENTAYQKNNEQNKCTVDGSSADVCIATGNSQVHGALVAGPVSVAQSTNVHYDAQLADLPLEVNADSVAAPPLSFLHISVNTVTVDGPMGGGATATPPTPNEYQLPIPTAAPTSTQTTKTPPMETATPARSVSFTSEDKNNGMTLTADVDDKSSVDFYEWDTTEDGNYENAGKKIDKLDVDSGTQVTLKVTYDDGSVYTFTDEV